MAKPKMERERIRKEYLTVIKRKHKGKKLISGAMERMLPLLYRDILTIINFIGVDDEAFSCLNKTEKRTLQAVIDMYPLPSSLSASASERGSGTKLKPNSVLEKEFTGPIT